MRLVRRLGLAAVALAVLSGLGVVRVTTPWNQPENGRPSSNLAGGHPRSWVYDQLIRGMKYPALLPTSLPEGSSNLSDEMYFLQPISTEYLGSRRHRDDFWKLPYWVTFEGGYIWDAFSVIQYPTGTRDAADQCAVRSTVRAEVIGRQELVVCAPGVSERTIDYLRTVEFSSDLERVTWLPD